MFGPNFLSIENGIAGALALNHDEAGTLNALRRERAVCLRRTWLGSAAAVASLFAGAFALKWLSAQGVGPNDVVMALAVLAVVGLVMLASSVAGWAMTQFAYLDCALTPLNQTEGCAEMLALTEWAERSGEQSLFAKGRQLYVLDYRLALAIKRHAQQGTSTQYARREQARVCAMVHAKVPD